MSNREKKPADLLLPLDDYHHIHFGKNLDIRESSGFSLGSESETTHCGNVYFIFCAFHLVVAVCNMLYGFLCVYNLMGACACLAELLLPIKLSLEKSWYFNGSKSESGRNSVDWIHSLLSLPLSICFDTSLNFSLCRLFDVQTFINANWNYGWNNGVFRMSSKENQISHWIWYIFSFFFCFRANVLSFVITNVKWME